MPKVKLQKPKKKKDENSFTMPKTTLIVPELGEGASRNRFSNAKPAESCLCSIFSEDDCVGVGDATSWKPDMDPPLSI